MKAIFFDRDGVINKSIDYYIYTKEKLILNDGVVETLLELKKNNYSFLVISNQSGIAKGLYTIEETEIINNEINETLRKYNIEFLEFYFCYHHPEETKCICRKPETLLYEKAIARFKINISESWAVGDQERDILPAKNLGLKTILIKSNSNLKQILPIILNEKK